MNPSRVVSLLASSTEIVCALGCGEWLVGRSHECDHPGWVRRLPALSAPHPDATRPSATIDRDVRALVEEGLSVYRVDAGALAALAPDVVLTQTRCAVCAVSLDDVERALAEVVASRPRLVALEPSGLATLWRDMRRVADALGVPERGLQLVTRLRQRMEGVGARAAGQRARPRVACLAWVDPIMTAGDWTPELVALAGGEDVFGSPGAPGGRIEWEALAAADPDVIFVAPCGFDLGRTLHESAALTSHPGWGALRAVRAGRVYLGDGNAYFNRPGPRVAETLEILAEALHPDAFRFGHEGVGWMRWHAGAADIGPRPVRAAG